MREVGIAMAFSKFHKQLAWFRQRYQGGMRTANTALGAEGGFKFGFQCLHFIFTANRVSFADEGHETIVALVMPVSRLSEVWI